MIGFLDSPAFAGAGSASAGITLALASARYENENGMLPKGRGRFETCPYGPHSPILIAMGEEKSRALSY